MRNCIKCNQKFDERLSDCPFCSTPYQDPSKSPKWYFRKRSLFISFLVVGPFMLPLVWFNPQYSQTKKTVLTAIIIIVTLLMTVAFGKSLEAVWKYYQELNVILK